ncbi:MAG TPA: hypothetical protein VKK79_08665, partial [Candidatus Lokiarchaeia archaeon]|nr:hypothetical protein [Candidatus Lokiarchaeia archaeon]
EVKDFIETGMVEFEAEIFYPEATGIHQIEKVGVHVDSNGLVTYGAHILGLTGAPMDDEEGEGVSVSIDKLCRILADITLDSSHMMSTVLSHHQKQLLDLVFFDQPLQRDKYACVLATQINPQKPAAEYLDSGPYENELMQVLDYSDFSVDLPDGGILHAGGHGLVLIAQDLNQYELLLTEYSFLRSIQIFFSNFFARIYSIEDDLRDIRRVLTSEISKDPRSISSVQERISKASFHCVLLKEVLGYLEDSLKENHENWHTYETTFTPHQQDLAELLQIPRTIHHNVDRLRDTQDIISGVNNEIQGLRDQVTVVSEKRLSSIFTQIKAGTAIQLKTQRAAERQSGSIQALQLILSGTFMFSLITFLFGGYSWQLMGWSDTGQAGAGGPIYIFPPDVPLIYDQIVFFLIAICAWVFFTTMIFLFLRRASQKADQNTFVKVTFEEPIVLPKLMDWLSVFDITNTDIEEQEDRTIRTVNFTIEGESPKGTWRGNTVNVTLSYDMENAFLYSIDLDINQPTQPEKFFEDTLKKVLKERGILHK